MAPETQEIEEKPVTSSASSNDILKMSVLSTIPSASLVKEEPKPAPKTMTTLIRTADGRYLFAPQAQSNGLGSQLTNARILKTVISE